MGDNKELIQPEDSNGDVATTSDRNGTMYLPLEAILSSPLFWPSPTVFVFLRDAYNCIKDDNDKAIEFKKDMDNDSQGKCAILGDWVRGIDPSHWEILQSEGSLAKTKNTKRVRHTSGQSVTQLLRLIRNKAEHYTELGEEQQIKLDWFTDGTFDQRKFVAYWVKTFPELLPFVWHKFHQFKDESTLKQYYPPHSQHEHNLRLTLSFKSLVMELTKTLNAHKENGGLVKRYKCYIKWPGHGTTSICTTNGLGGSCILEFRTLDPEQLIPSMVPWTSTLKVEINNNGLCSTWINHNAEDGNVTESSIRVNINLEKDCLPSLTLLIGVNLDERLANEVCSLYKFSPNHVILLTSRPMNILYMQKIVQKLCDVNQVLSISEWNFNFCEISSPNQLQILQRTVIFQNKEVQFQSLLPKSFIQSNSLVDIRLLDWLEGEFLHELITDSKPTLFADTLIHNSDFYIVRRIIGRGNNITSKTLRHESQDVILVTNISFDLLKQLSKTDDVSRDLLAEPNNRIFLVESETDFQDFCNRLPKNKNCHMLKFVENDKFQWQRSHGSIKLLQNQKLLDKTDTSILEDEFISQIIQQTVRHPIIIADKPGMGKSWLLRSLAEKLSKFENHFVIFIAMNDFMKELGKSITKSAIIETISKFVAKTAAEKELIKLWSETVNADVEIKCNLMFDGMDEVTKHKGEAKKVLKVLHRECPSIRLWITVRDHMLEEMEESLGVFGYKIVPFEESDQIRFLQNYWQKELAVDEESSEYKSLCKFAEECTKSLLQGASKSSFTSEIAGIPLQCRMVAEVYQSILNQRLGTDTNNDCILPDSQSICLTDLYQKVIDKKLEEYLRKSNPNLDLALGYVDFIRVGMKKVHWYLAIKLLFPNNWAATFSIMLINGIQNRTIDTIVEIGLIQKQEPLTFVHRTFAEYYIALFVFEICTSKIKLEPSSQEAWARFVAAMVLDVASEQFEHNPVTLSSIVIATFKFPVICYFLNALLENCSDLVIDRKLVKLVCRNCHDFQSEASFQCKISKLVAAIKNDFFQIFQLLFESIDMHERDKFIAETKDYHDFFLNVSVKCSSVDFFKYICTLLKDWYMRVENLEHKISSEIFYTAIRKGRYEIVKFLVSEKGFGSDTWADLQNSDKDKYGLIHHCLRKSRKVKRSVIEEKKRIIEFFLGLDKSVLEVRDGKGRTPLLLQIDASIMLKKWLVSHGANVHAIGDTYGNTGLHWHYFDKFKTAISPNGYHEMLELFTGDRNFDINRISSGNTPLHCAMKTYYDELRHESLELFQKQGADFNILDNDGKSVLHLAVEKNCELGFIEKLITLGSDPKIKNSEGKDALDLAINCANSNLEELLVSIYY